jgi:uncharacterized protein (TIGR01777 family)
MLIAMTGSSGLIGTALRKRLQADGHEVLRVLRGQPEQPEALWDPPAGWFRKGALEGADAVIHLAGADIAGKRWSERRKRLLWESRVDATRLLVDHIGRLARRPQVLISASAVGYYGDRGEEMLTEATAAGEGFLSELCQGWERESRRAQELGVRTVQLRTAGSVLARNGGALPRMAPPFRLGLGARLGSGRQWFTWVSLDDEVGAIRHLMHADSVEGAVNVMAPEPVTNAEFTRALGRALHRPAPFRVPAFALRLLLGELADEALLASQRAVPARLTESGYEFAHADLQGALEAALRG